MFHSQITSVLSIQLFLSYHVSYHIRQNYEVLLSAPSIHYTHCTCVPTLDYHKAYMSACLSLDTVQKSPNTKYCVAQYCKTSTKETPYFVLRNYLANFANT
jgi:hypothetical protein